MPVEQLLLRAPLEDEFEMGVGKSIYQRALLDPASVFATPDAVVESSSLTPTEKIEVLRRWEYDVAEVSVAQEEGMAPRVAAEGHILQRVRVALGRLAGNAETIRAAPTKHGGAQMTPKR